MNKLGRLEDLPPAYLDALRDLNLVPLWPSLRALLPPDVPTRQTEITHWPFEQLRPLLLQAGELTPIERAERRVLVLANPGHGLDKMQASAAMYLGMQLLLPGEWAPAHRHTPNAVRMIVEGEGAYTTVDGQKCPMHRGDLILTPSGVWHEHGHEGTSPVIWLDVLDLPLVHYLETSYHVDGERQRVHAPPPAYVGGGLQPTRLFERSNKSYPVLRYPWSKVRAALEAQSAASEPNECVQITYANPETGCDVQRVLGYYALMLKPGQRLNLPARSPAVVFHMVEGAATVIACGRRFDMAEADTCCIPGYEEVTLINMSASSPSFLFLADETPLHRQLGLLETRQ